MGVNRERVVCRQCLRRQRSRTFLPPIPPHHWIQPVYLWAVIGSSPPPRHLPRTRHAYAPDLGTARARRGILSAAAWGEGVMTANSRS